jgi:hypothetical protein
MNRPPPAGIAPGLERKLAAGIHLAGIVAGILAPLAGALVWGSAASPWLRRHLRDALIHWGAVLLLLLAAIALDTMNPVYDFGLLRTHGVAGAAYSLGITRAYGLLAWATSAVFAALSARRALRGQGPYYPFTLWWNARGAPPALPAHDEPDETR